MPTSNAAGARTLALAVGLAGLLLVAGCSSKGTAGLMGDVSYDGKPLPEGTIVFTPVDGATGPSTGGNIKDGHYDVPAEKGALPGASYKVEITSQAKTGKTIPNIMQPGGPPMELTEQFLPAVYNTQSTLRVKVAPGTNRFDFHLEKKAK